MNLPVIVVLVSVATALPDVGHDAPLARGQQKLLVEGTFTAEVMVSPQGEGVSE